LAVVGAADAVELSFGGSLELLHAVHENILARFCFGGMKRGSQAGSPWQKS
jgi:hypothetical protein